MSGALVKSGIRENAAQFMLLVVINLFVGSMVGLERTILPIIGEEQFGLASTSAALSFIISFGLSKAVMNLFAGHIADRIGRKHVLLLGWIIGLFVPFLVIYAEAWWVIVFAIQRTTWQDKNLYWFSSHHSLHSGMHYKRSFRRNAKILIELKP
jgi:MFS family permease